MTLVNGGKLSTCQGDRFYWITLSTDEMPCVGVYELPGPPEHLSTFCQSDISCARSPWARAANGGTSPERPLCESWAGRPFVSPTAPQLVVSAETQSRQGQSHHMGSLCCEGSWACQGDGNVCSGGPQSWPPNLRLILPLDDSISRVGGILGRWDSW